MFRIFRISVTVSTARKKAKKTFVWNLNLNRISMFVCVDRYSIPGSMLLYMNESKSKINKQQLK